MKILFLGYEDTPLIDFICRKDEVHATSSRVTKEEVDEYGPDLIVSYGYKHIIKEDILEPYRNKIINLHISLLPWNRGYHPNFWSFVDGTPKGVTIHLIDEGIDTGDILVQREVIFDVQEDTLATTYMRLRKEIESLFIDNWEPLKERKILPAAQSNLVGSGHYKKDLNQYWDQLPCGWNTKIKWIEEL